MPNWIPQCPLGGSRIDVAKVKYGIPFPCPHCKKLLHVSGFYLWLPTVFSFLFCLLLGYLFGFRLPKLLIVSFLFLFPVNVLAMLVVTGTWNPRITGHYPDYFDLKRRF
jgi:hypothetical protein